MADEKRRLIYELLVEAKGADNAKHELDGLGASLTKLGGVAKGALGILGAGFALKGIAGALDDLTKFNQAMAGLGVTGKSASQALESVQNIAFTTMTSMEGVTDVYKEAVQLQQALGRSTENAARTTDAFIRIANAEGKSVAAAAQAVNFLSFALERGVLPQREFISMLRDSPTFAKAAQVALGATTAQLSAMAKEGTIGAEALTKIVIEMEKIGASTATAVTIGGIVDGLKVLTTTIVQAIAEGARFNATINTQGTTGMQAFLDTVRAMFLEIGGIIGVINNALQQMFNVAALGINAALNPFEAAEAWKHYKTEVQRDLDDMTASAEQFKRGLAMGSDADPNYSAAGKAAKELAQANADAAAIERARMRDMAMAFGSSFDESVKKWKKAQEDRVKQQADYDAKAKLLRDKSLQDELDAFSAMVAARGRVAADAAQYEADLKKLVQADLSEFAKKNEKSIEDALEKQGTLRIEGLRKQVFQEIDVYTEAAFVIKDAFADLFTGGISNAREFFRTIAEGLSRMFAQMAAMQAAEEIMGWAKMLLGGFSGGGASWSSQASAAGISARGNVFERGALVPFARGGIVTRPTVFPMASGGVGLMGEAGPEAVMPLRRMASGRLGVSAAQSNITIVNQTGVAATARVAHSGDRLSIVLEAAQMGARMAEDRFNRSVRTGYGAAAQAVQSTYGLRRKV